MLLYVVLIQFQWLSKFLSLVSYHPFLWLIGLQWASIAQDCCGQVCPKGAPCTGQCQLGHQTDPVATQHPDRVSQSGHAGCLPGRTADTQEQGTHYLSLSKCDYTLMLWHMHSYKEGYILSGWFTIPLCLCSCPCWLTGCCWRRQ